MDKDEFYDGLIERIDNEAANSRINSAIRFVKRLLHSRFGDQIAVKFTSEQTDYLFIESMITDPIGQGLGTEAMQVICKVADAFKLTIAGDLQVLEPYPIGHDGFDKDRLFKFCNQFGFIDGREAGKTLSIIRYHQQFDCKEDWRPS